MLVRAFRLCSSQAKVEIFIFKIEVLGYA